MRLRRHPEPEPDLYRHLAHRLVQLPDVGDLTDQLRADLAAVDTDRAAFPAARYVELTPGELAEHGNSGFGGQLARADGRQAGGTVSR